MPEPRKDWTLDSEGSSWAAESTYDERRMREKLERQAGDTRSKLASIRSTLRARSDRDRG